MAGQLHVTAWQRQLPAGSWLAIAGDDDGLETTGEGNDEAEARAAAIDKYSRLANRLCGNRSNDDGTAEQSAAGL